MRSSVLLILVGLLYCLVAATAVEKRSFKLETKRNPHFNGQNGPRELAKAYHKYNQPLPRALAQAEGKHAKRWSRGDGLIPATPNTQDEDVEYLCPVIIGYQRFNLLFDTASSDLWVFNTLLPSPSAAGHVLFDPNAYLSSFRLLDGYTFDIQYANGLGASGAVGHDAIQIGGMQFLDQAIQLPVSLSWKLQWHTKSSGILGLGFSQMNTVKPEKQKTFFDNIMPILPHPLFTVDMSNKSMGVYEFGRIDRTKFRTDQMTWQPVDTSHSHWQVGTNRFGVDGENQEVPVKGWNGGQDQAILDTSSKLMLVPYQACAMYYSQVVGAMQDWRVYGGWSFPCDAVLPDLFVDIGGVAMARVKGEHINFAPAYDDRCYGGLQQWGGETQIWGQVFFRSQFVVFNMGNRSVGLAERS